MQRQYFFCTFLLFAIFARYLCQDDINPMATLPSNSVADTPKTTTKSPKTTTKAPETTTTTIKPTTETPTPSPTPVPTFVSGNVTENNYTCVRYEFNAVFEIKYQTEQNLTKVAHLPLPLNVSETWPNGTCSKNNNKKESFNLLSIDQNSAFRNLTLSFVSTESSVYLDSILLGVKFDNQTFPNINSIYLNTTEIYNINSSLTPNFNVEKAHSYFCANVTVPKSEDSKVRVVFSGLRLQAFMEISKNGQFSAEHNCQSEINDIVPISVGAALTGLVIIVMVAYFIGRRRSRRLAYQSV